MQLISSPLTSDSVRYGLTASRRLGIAVERNRAKRRLRELMRRHLVELGLPGYDYGFVARKAVLTAPFEALEKDLKWALGHVHRQLRQQNDKEGFSGDADPS